MTICMSENTIILVMALLYLALSLALLSPFIPVTYTAKCSRKTKVTLKAIGVVIWFFVSILVFYPYASDVANRPSSIIEKEIIVTSKKGNLFGYSICGKGDVSGYSIYSNNIKVSVGDRVKLKYYNLSKIVICVSK